MVTRYLVETINDLKDNTEFEPGLRGALLVLYWDIIRTETDSKGTNDDLVFATWGYHKATIQRHIFRDTVGTTLDGIDAKYANEPRCSLRKRILVLLDLAVAQLDLSIKEIACQLADIEVLTV